MKGLFRPIGPREVSPGYWTAAKVWSELRCAASNFFPTRIQMGYKPYRHFDLAGGWWYFTNGTLRSFGVNLFDHCRRDWRAYQRFMREGLGR